jgi:hypothetical protein
MKTGAAFCMPLCAARAGLAVFLFPIPAHSAPGNTDRFLGAPVKRGADHHCASGAGSIGTRLVNKFSSCDCADEAALIVYNHDGAME